MSSAGRTRPVLGLQLDPTPEAVGRARQFARQRAADLGADPDTLDSIVLLVSELVTNVVLHAHTPALVDVSEQGPRIRVSVADGSAGRPRLRRFGPLEATGRGTRLLRVLAAESGVDPDHRVGPVGKCIWFAVGKASTALDVQSRLEAMMDLFDVDGLETA